MPAEASPLKVTIMDSVKDAMRAKDKARLSILRHPYQDDQATP